MHHKTGTKLSQEIFGILDLKVPQHNSVFELCRDNILKCNILYSWYNASNHFSDLGFWGFIKKPSFPFLDI